MFGQKQEDFCSNSHETLNKRKWYDTGHSDFYLSNPVLEKLASY